MKYNRLGNSELIVSEVCLGTMTWGVQNTEADAHEQLDYAISRGVNFLDTAEAYPVPTTVPGQVPGTTERYIGTYLAKHPEARSKLIIATKVMGFMPNSKTVAHRHDPPLTKEPFPTSRLDGENIRNACAASLHRLQTSYIDLYQLHWPDRAVPLFGHREYRVDQEHDSVPIRETLIALKGLLDEGKIRAYGLSNESTFGVCEFVRIADELDMPRPASIQNAFCLINRQFEGELAEACAPRNFNIGLLPWSILGGGSLTGKYNKELEFPDDHKKAHEGIEDARHALYPSFQIRYKTPAALNAILKYTKIAQDNGMSTATLAQAFCKSRWYIPSSIIGATKMSQLKENIDAFEIDLDDKVLASIDEVHNENKDVAVVV